jgi:hypothetical protein
LGTKVKRKNWEDEEERRGEERRGALSEDFRKKKEKENIVDYTVFKYGFLCLEIPLERSMCMGHGRVHAHSKV